MSPSARRNTMKKTNRKVNDRRPKALASSRSLIARAAIYRSGAGIHADQKGRYKRHPKHRGTGDVDT